MDIEEHVIELIADQLAIKKEDIKPGSRLAGDLNADSLDVAELIMSFEEHFDLHIPDEEAEKLHTVESIVEHIKKHRNGS